MKVYCIYKEWFQGDDCGEVHLATYKSIVRCNEQLDLLEAEFGGVSGEYEIHFIMRSVEVIE